MTDLFDLLIGYVLGRLLLTFGRVRARYGGIVLYTLEFVVNPPPFVRGAPARVVVRRIAGVWRWSDGDPFPSSLVPALERLVA